MRLPLPWGISLLAGLWVLHAFLSHPAEKTALLIVAMGVAMWTAFSLNIPEKKPEPERSLLEPPEEEEVGTENNPDSADWTDEEEPEKADRNGRGD